jgi:hypothetical protein
MQELHKKAYAAGIAGMIYPNEYVAVYRVPTQRMMGFKMRLTCQRDELRDHNRCAALRLRTDGCRPSHRYGGTKPADFDAFYELIMWDEASSRTTNTQTSTHPHTRALAHVSERDVDLCSSRGRAEAALWASSLSTRWRSRRSSWPARSG